MQGIAALNKNTTAMNKALERLSTGCRINSSKDDAAGCAISTSLTKEVSSLNVAQNNAQMGQSMVDTANGALNNMSNMLQRIRDLAEQSANGTYGADERKAMQTEVDNLLSELQRTKTSTEFNGKQIFGKAITSKEDAIEQGYTVVTTAQELKDSLTTDADCKVMLFADIDLSDLEEVDGSNWTAVGTSSISFKGTLDGNGFTISNLKINKPDTSYQGLFGRAEGATIKNVTLENVDVKGNNNTGGLVGLNFSSSTISNCSSSGTVTGNGERTGGLVGTNYSSSISNCSSSGTVTGYENFTGGLVGLNFSSSTISNCSSSGTVTGNNWTGGLVGYNNHSAISNCDAYVKVIGYDRVGGLIGENSNGISENCVSFADVTGNTCVGGFVGLNYYSTSLINNCLSTGTVSGNRGVGGFAGGSAEYATITNSKTTSIVSGSSSSSTGAFSGDISQNSTFSDNEYNSTINEGMRAIANVASPTEEQIVDNTELKIVADPSIGSQIPKVAFGVGVDTTYNLQVGINNDSNSVISVDTGLAFGEFNIDITTEGNARTALATIDRLMGKMTDKQTELGAISARLDSAMQYQQIQRNTKIATNSIIKDADFAAESSNYIKQQILQQTTSSLLSTANQNPNIALMLLNMNR